MRALAYNPECRLVAAGLGGELATLLDSHDRCRVRIRGTVGYIKTN